jgi:hypothetical protein
MYRDWEEKIYLLLRWWSPTQISVAKELDEWGVLPMVAGNVALDVVGSSTTSLHVSGSLLWWGDPREAAGTSSSGQEKTKVESALGSCGYDGLLYSYPPAFGSFVFAQMALRGKAWKRKRLQQGGLRTKFMKRQGWSFAIVVQAIVAGRRLYGNWGGDAPPLLVRSVRWLFQWGALGKGVRAGSGQWLCWWSCEMENQSSLRVQLTYGNGGGRWIPMRYDEW